MKLAALLLPVALVVSAASLFRTTSAGAEPAATPETKAFTDISKSSGLDAVIDAHYQREPKWWLSGTNLVDLDGDGHLDIFLGAHGQTGAVALNDGHGHFRDVDPKSTKLPPTEIHIAADIDGDGKVDLQMTHQDGGGRWFRNASTGGTPNFEATSFISGQGRENALIDVDRDGKLDWVHEDGHNAAIMVELGDGKGGFKPSNRGFPALKESSAIPVDLDGDGKIDFVLKQCGYHDEKTGHACIMMNTGDGFADRTEACGLPKDDVVIQGVGDVNQDGATDLICLENGKEVAIYLNDGNAHFKKLDNAIAGMEKVSHPHYANWGIATIMDLDNDGIPDVLMNGRNFLYILRGTGGGHFVCMNKAWGITDFAWSTVDEGLCFGDVDGDGRLDLVVSAGAEKQKRMALLHNDLPPKHWLNVRPIGADGNRPAAGAKIRVTGPSTGRLLWYEQVVIAGRQTAHSYYSYGVTERHIGLGDRDAVDVSVEFYPSGKIVKLAGAKENQTVEVKE